MRLTLPKIRLYSIILCLVVLGFAGGWWLGHRDLQIQKNGFAPKITISREIPQDKKDVNFALFWEVWDRLQASYVDKSKLDSSKMVYGAIQGMVAAIGDPYTVFLPPDDQKRSKEDLGGEFEGVGIQIGFKGSQLAVMAPLDGSPAQKAGVQAGDFIIGIKDDAKKLDTSTSGMTLPDAVNAIRGTAGTKVTLLLTRAGQDKPITVEIERKKIDVPSVVLTYEGSNKQVAHLKLMKFGEQTNGEWDKAVQQIQINKPNAVILDMRNNPGGFLNGAVFIASDFVKSGTIVSRQDGQGNKQDLNALGKPRLQNITLIVLVNKGSASASEIVAGALKDYSRGKIVGDSTFGKGTVQESIELGNAGIHITTEKWLTPKGTWVHGTGLEPDVKVADDPNTPEDEQLQKALELLGAK
jgi:carboxyl-terminal processing protease